MSLSVIPLTILGQITGVTGSGETALYQVSFKSIDGTPLYGVTAVWTDEQAGIEALAAQKSYGVWINPVDGTFTVKFAGYTYKGSVDLTNPDVLAGITPIVFNNEAAGGGGSGDLKTTTLSVTLTNFNAGNNIISGIALRNGKLCVWTFSLSRDGSAVMFSDDGNGIRSEEGDLTINIPDCVYPQSINVPSVNYNMNAESSSLTNAEFVHAQYTTLPVGIRITGENPTIRLNTST